HLWLEHAGWRRIMVNLASATAIVVAAIVLTAFLGTPSQWIALGIGAYGAISWIQALRLRDRVSFELILRTPSLRYSGFGFALLAFAGYGIGFWTPPFFMRVHGLDAGRAGLTLGGTAAVAGWLGAACGGLVADHWRRTNPKGRLYVAMLTASL